MFKLFYLAIATVAYIVAIPFLLLLALKSKYKVSIPARFFLYKNRPLQCGGIHFHVCSYGEAKAIKPLVELLKDKKLRCTTTTQTGFSIIKEYTKEARFLPFEIFLPFWIKPQKALVVAEAELWYMLFLVAKAKGAKTFLINARVSSKSYPNYLRFKWFYKKIFKNIDAVYAQSFDDAKRLAHLGAKNIKVNGNIKFFGITKPSKAFPKKIPLVITAASTHEGEEETILEAFKALREAKKAQLIVAPRHPERFEQVAKMIEKTAAKERLSFSRYSKNQEFATDIVLIDAMGELVNAYAISDIVILGGAFVPIGGHNALEAAQFGCKIISGPHFFNQSDIFKTVPGIEIAQREHLKDTLLNYEALPNTKIDTKADIGELIEDIKSVL